MAQAYDFEPEHSDNEEDISVIEEAGDQGEVDRPPVADRVGQPTYWCLCGCSQPLPTSVECQCCCEMEKVRDK